MLKHRAAADSLLVLAAVAALTATAASAAASATPRGHHANNAAGWIDLKHSQAAYTPERSVPHRREDGPAGVGKYDFFLFVQGWPGVGFEFLGPDLKWTPVPPPADVTYFSMHGLWANRWNGTWPQFCGGRQFAPSDVTGIEHAMRHLWWDTRGPDSYDFWAHEWNKHGTCSKDNPLLDTPPKFFQFVLDSKLRFDIRSILTRHGIVPSIKAADATYRLSDVYAALNETLGVHTAVDCAYDEATDTTYLSQVMVCLSKPYLTRINCPAGLIEAFRADCSKAKGKPDDPWLVYPEIPLPPPDLDHSDLGVLLKQIVVGTSSVAMLLLASHIRAVELPRLRSSR